MGGGGGGEGEERIRLLDLTKEYGPQQCNTL